VPHPLDEAHAKLARARGHLEELDREVRRFTADHPYGLRFDDESEPGVIVVRAEAHVLDEPVPMLIGVIVGDVLHNLRSAIEYLAWHLATLHRGPDKETHFPVCDTPAKWRDFGLRFTRRMRPDHKAFIERMQPYHGRHGILLTPVSALNNTDKHALISAVSWGSQFRPPTITGEVLSMRIEYEGHVPMHDGAPLFRIVELEYAPGSKVNVHMDVPYTVLFGKPFVPGEVAASKLDLVRAERYIRLVLRVFRDEF
jgi:hypothetical protein